MNTTCNIYFNYYNAIITNLIGSLSEENTNLLWADSRDERSAESCGDLLRASGLNDKLNQTYLMILGTYFLLYLSAKVEVILLSFSSLMKRSLAHRQQRSHGCGWQVWPPYPTIAGLLPTIKFIIVWFVFIDSNVLYHGLLWPILFCRLLLEVLRSQSHRCLRSPGRKMRLGSHTGFTWVLYH